MSKIVILLGRGVEGCGVTRYTIEMIEYLKSYNADFVCWASNKKWSRTTECEDIKIYNTKKQIGTDDCYNDCMNADYIIINSLPPKSDTQESIAFFERLLKEPKAKKSFIQHDHANQSIIRNALLDESIEYCNQFFVHSRNNPFAKRVKDATQIGTSSLSSFFGDDEEGDEKELIRFQPGMSFDEVRKLYWKPIEEQDVMHHKWIGRSTTWKGYDLLVRFHEKYLKDNKCLTTMEGIDRSPAYLAFVELVKDFHYCIDKDPETHQMEYGDNLYVYGPYNHEAMLDRISRCAFGYQLSLLKPHFIERSIEYTHCEVVATGTVPVFRKEYGDLCHHRKYDKPLTECKDSGTIWLTDTIFDESWKLMHKLANDNIMRDEYREMAYEFYKLHQDAKHTFNDLFTCIKHT